MSIPSPEERPDLYDYYDGRADGSPSAVSAPPEILKLIEERKAQRQATQDQKLDDQDEKEATA